MQMSWMEHGVKRGSLHRGKRVDEDEGMEDNSLYSGRETGTVCLPEQKLQRLSSDVCIRLLCLTLEHEI